MSFWKMWLLMKRLFRTGRTRIYLAVVCVAGAAAAGRLLAGGLLGTGTMDLEVIDLVIQARLHESILDEKGTSCEVPSLDPFSEEAIRYDHGQPKVKCEGTDWVQCHVSKCYVIEEVLKSMKEIYCIYKDILYINDNKYVMGEPVKLYGNETYTLNKSDHVKVSCTGTEVGAILPSIWLGHKIGFRVVEKTQPHNIKQIKRPPQPCKPLNVMILCFHSTSRNRFTRRMPRSLKVLTEELNATIFNIHSIVGEGIAAALFPLMTGKSEVEFPDTRKRTSKAYIDVKNFIFHFAKINGFRTALYEDVEYVGTFQNQYNGFSQQPADHYLRTFHLDAILNRKLPTSYRNRHCIGSTPLHKKILQLTQQLPKLEGKYFCLSLIGQIYHDPYNLVDDDVAYFLRDLKQTGALQKTLLIILGDHGPRFGRFRYTYQGIVEERLPLMVLVLPEKFKACQPEITATVEANSRILTTHFDVFATALDAMDLQEHANSFRVRSASMPRAMSLLKPIRKNRSCGEAGVLPHWCACSKWVDVPRSDIMHTKVANVLAEFINNLTDPVRSNCEERTLTSIVWVMRQSLKEEVFKNGDVVSGSGYSGIFGRDLVRPSMEYYQAKIVLSPAGAVFEGTVVLAAASGALALRPGSVARVGAYAEEAACLADTHPDLLKYCYCKKRTFHFSYKTIKIS